MSTKQNSLRPGPVARSCMTCRRRRKKCDRTRPRCERCIKAKMDCLGYDNLDDLGSVGLLYETVSALEVEQAQHVRVVSAYLQSSEQNTDITTGSTCSPGSATAISSCASEDLYLSTPKSSLSGQNLTSRSPGPLVHLAPRSHSSIFPVSLFASESWQFKNNRPLFAMQSIPKGMPTISIDIAGMIDTFMSQYERLTRLTLFKPTHQQALRLCHSLSWRLQHFDSTRKVTRICLKIFEHMLEGTSTQNYIAIYQTRIKRLEQELAVVPDESLGPVETYGHLSSALEVALFQVKLSDGTNTYQTLRTYAPIFLRAVFSDPTLWTSTRTFASVSLAHVLASDGYELCNFVSLDMLCSMAYGLPQVIEYDTSTPLSTVPAHSSEWIHGCPDKLQVVIIEINARYLSKRMGPVLAWRDLEQRTQGWQPPVRTTSGEKSWRTVARLAIQESWRHTVLVYLYMVACGVMSDDPRVRSSVRQVFQIIDTVKHKLHSVNNVHFLMQYLIAGACTPSQKQRAWVRAKLLESVENGLRVFNMSDFVRLLDHLWCGAGVDGRPISWSDYVCSRQAVIPMSA